MLAIQAKRPGRPDARAAEALAEHILSIAAHLFITQGYAATSLEQIAAAAGSGKQTLYRRFESKQGLFMAVLRAKTQHLLALAQTSAQSDQDPLVGLKRTARSLLDFLLQPEMIRLNRIMIAEISRFPELCDSVFQDCVGPVSGPVMQLLQRAADQGDVKGDLETAHKLLLSLLTGWPLQESLIGRAPFAGTCDREAYFEAAWGMFLAGVRAR